MSMPLRIGEKRKLFQGHHLALWETEFFDRDGKRGTWEWTTKHDAVFIFPITPEQKVVLIKIFRVPLERYTLELPAGLRDKKDEPAEECAHRELTEETGYRARTLVPVHPWPYRSGSSSNISYGFIATGLEKVHEGAHEATEDIEVMEIPMDSLLDFYMEHSGSFLINTGILALHSIARHLQIRG